MLTIIIIGVTVIVSVMAFNNREVFDKLKFNAYFIHQRKEWYRVISYGLIDADWMHLAINMFVLYSFGNLSEAYFTHYFGVKGTLYFGLLYVGGVLFSTLFDFGKQKDNPYYAAVGASGAVSAVLFSSILFDPSGSIFPFPYLPGCSAFFTWPIQPIWGREEKTTSDTMHTSGELCSVLFLH